MSDSMVQIKFTIDSDTVSVFKAKCVSEGISMASIISQFMKTCKPVKNPKIKTETRPLRKKAVIEIISLLEDIMQKEENYRDAIPDQFISRYETSDQTCEQLSQAISNLEEAYL